MLLPAQIMIHVKERRFVKWMDIVGFLEDVKAVVIVMNLQRIVIWINSDVSLDVRLTTIVKMQIKSV